MKTMNDWIKWYKKYIKGRKVRKNGRVGNLIN